MKKIKMFLPYFKPYIRTIIISSVLMLIASVISLLPPRFIGYAVDSLNKDNFNIVIVFASYAIGVTIIGALINYIISRLYIKIQNEVIFNIRKDIFTAAIDMSYAESSKIEPGEINTRIMVDVRNIANLFSVDTIGFLISIVKVVIVFSYLMFMSPKLTIITFLQIIPILFIFNTFFIRYYDKTKSMQKKLDDVYSLIHHYINGLKTIKLLAIEKKTSDVAENSLKEAKEKDVDFLKVNSLIELVRNVFPIFNIIIVWMFGGYEVFAGRMSIGDLITFELYVWIIYGPLTQIMGLSGTISSGVASIDRINEIVTKKNREKQEIAENIIDRETSAISGKIVVEDVNFSYDDNKKPVLNNFSLTITANSLIGIIGPSGIGKSTLAQLIVRLLESESGNIWLDDKDIKDIPEQKLREKVCFVENNTYIFGRSLHETLMIPKDRSRDKEAINILKRIGLLAFAQSLENKQEYDIGINGNKISSGQMHRLSIARALLKKPKILIIDEALSSVDITLELQIIDVFKEYTKDMTIILITHSLNFIDHFNKIFLLSKNEEEGVLTPKEFNKPNRKEIVQYLLEQNNLNEEIA